MSFYSRDSGYSNVAQRNINKKNATLQVRIQTKDVAFMLKPLCGKKTYLSVFASLTLEASLALTLFIFVVVCMILPMRIMNTDRKVQAGLEDVGEDFSRYAYLKQALESDGVFQAPGAGDFAKEFCKHLGGGAAIGYAQVRIHDDVDSSAVQALRMIRSSPMEDGEWFDLIVDYEIRMPFPVLGMSSITRSARSRRRAWIGKKGKDYGVGGGAETEEEDPLVYIGKGSTRYHKSRSCHYLANQLQTVPFDSVSDRRNDSGGKYYECSVCGGAALSGGVVYIMPSGSSYHSTKTCRAIVAYVQAIRLSQVEHLGPCSYCSK